MVHRLSWMQVVIGASLCLVSHAESRGQAPDYLQANSVSQVVERWVPGTHLYVIGKLPETSDAELRTLAGWLKGKHWYVVLARSADGQTYTDVHGDKHSGVEAMDYALGRGIGHKDGFEALAHPRTGEKDGAIFGLYLDNRKLYLRTTEAHDHRGLSGEHHFVGQLDQWAKNAMRSKGAQGVVAAAKDTITNVGAQLEATIAQEAETGQAAVERASVKLAELERRGIAFQAAHPGEKKTLAAIDLGQLRAQVESGQTAMKTGQYGKAVELTGVLPGLADSTLAAIDAYERGHLKGKSALLAATARLDDLAIKSKVFAKAYPGLTGDLVRVDLAGMQADMQVAQTELETSTERALALAQKVEERVSGIAEALVRYPSAGGLLKEEATRLAALERREGAGAARQKLLEAKQTLASGTKSYAAGDSAYLTLSTRVATELDSAERLIATAEAEAARAAAQAARRAAQWRFFLWILSMIAAVVVTATALRLHLSARRYRSQAQKLLADWVQALNEKIEVVQGDFDERYRTWISAYLGKCTGRTQQLVEQARVSRGWVAILWALAQDRLKQVRGLVEPGPLGQAAGLFWAGNYRRALGFEQEKVTFRPDDEELLRELFGKERTWEDKLLGNLRDYAVFQASFAELVAQLNAHAQTVLNAVKEIETSALGLAPKLQAVEAAAVELAGQEAPIKQLGSGGLFLVPSLYAALVPALRTTSAAARAKGGADPVEAYEGEAAQAERMMHDGRALAALIVKTGAGVRSQIGKATEAIRAEEIDSRWVEVEISRLSDEAEAIAASAVTQPAAARIAALNTGLDALGEEAGRVLALAQDRGRILKRIAQAQVEVAEARHEISQRTGVATERLLKEKGWQVDNKLFHARNRADEAAELLRQRGLEKAQEKLEEAKRFGQQVSEVLQISLAAARSYHTIVPALATEATRIAALIPEHQAILEQIRAGYAPSVLKLTGGDAAHPGANGLLDDNIAETERHLKQADEDVRNADVAFKEGLVLETADLLNAVKGKLELALHRLGEIKEKQVCLRETQKTNVALLRDLRGKEQNYRTEIEADARTMNPTLDALHQATDALNAAAKALEAEKGDPFAVRVQLETVAGALEDIHGDMARTDRDLFNQADLGVKAAERQLAPLRLLVREATGDDVPDSQPITSAARDTRRLEQELKQACSALGEKHGNWQALGGAANRIAAEAGRLGALVKGEMDKATAAVDQIAQAASKVAEAAAWTGSFGVQILGCPGDNLLENARGLLAQGRYVEADRQAASARQTAEQALAAAVAAELKYKWLAEEKRRKEEEKRRQEERKRQASSSDNSQSIWNFGGTSSSGGFFGSTPSSGGIFDGFSGSGGGSSSFGGFSSSGGGSSGW